ENCGRMAPIRPRRWAQAADGLARVDGRWPTPRPSTRWPPLPFLLSRRTEAVMRRTVPAFLATALLAAMSCTAIARPITHEDLWRMPRVAAPVPSPDGSQAVFTVTFPEYEADRSSTDIWLVATDGRGQPRQLTFDRGGESGLAWSPDGRRIAFVAKRGEDEAPQAFVLDLAGGGEAERVNCHGHGPGKLV